MTQTSTPDAEALYHALRDQAQALMPPNDRASWSVAGIHSGGAWIAERLAADLKLGEHGVINVASTATTTPKRACTARRSQPRCRSPCRTATFC